MASFFHSLIILFFVSLLISRISFESSGYPKIFLSRLQSNSNPGVISLSSQEGNVVRRNLLNSFPERWKIKLKNYIKIYPTQQNFLSFRILSFHIHPQAPLNNTLNYFYMPCKLIISQDLVVGLVKLSSLGSSLMAWLTSG